MPRLTANRPTLYARAWNWEAVSGRKGSGTFTIIARGKAAHAGRDPQLGHNAIHALAAFIGGLAALQKEHPGIVINTGWIGGGGPVNIDMAAARARKIRVVNTPGRNGSAVAEFTIGAILTETRNIRRGHESLRSGEWRGDLYRADLTGEELSEMTVGVIGYGHVGTKVVKFLKAFGCRILVCDPYVQLSRADREDGVELA